MRTALEKAMFRKVMRVKGVRHKSQRIKYWIEEATEQTANTTKNGNNHRHDSKMCKTKPVLSEAGAGGFKLDEAKIRAKGKV